jgi:hypothetical protein
MSYNNNHDISEFIGGHLVTTTGLEIDSGKVDFLFKDGRHFTMCHEQDCCEYVKVADVIGDLSDLQDATVIDAREEKSRTDPDGYNSNDEYRESFTWTFYVIQTNKGAVTIRWLGESNGYYGEEVDIELSGPTA